MDKNIIIVLLLILSISCRDEEITPEEEFAVIIVSTSDFACRLPLIQFLEKEEKVKEKTSYESVVFNAYRLDNSLNEIGKKLIIRFDALGAKDFRVCNTMGINYPGIAIVSAREE